MCSSNVYGHISDDRHATHMKRKTEAQNSKSRDKRVYGRVSHKRLAVHMKRKTEAQNEKLRDRSVAKDYRHTAVVTLDLQVVLLAPKLFANVSYFKTKLACHDVTLYNLETKTAPCRLWHEGQGGVISNNFACCIWDYLVTVANRSPAPLK